MANRSGGSQAGSQRDKPVPALAWWPTVGRGCWPPASPGSQSGQLDDGMASRGALPLLPASPFQKLLKVNPSR